MIIAAVAGLVAVYLINIYIQQTADETRKREQERRKELATVVIAKQDIASGTAIKDTMVKEEIISKSLIQPRAASSLDRVVDRITIAPISKGEQVLLNKVTLSGEAVSLSTKIPRGKRAITIPVDNISSVGGMIRPGDHVDVVSMIPIPGIGQDGKPSNQMNTTPLFQDVLVLAVGQEYAAVPGGQKGEKRQTPIITLALAPQEANLIAFIQEQGRIRLILRSPGDSGSERIAPANWESVLRMTIPEMFERGEEAPAPKPRKTVEIYRGLQKEVKPLD
ncbi:MAG: Flp pilus assembly protein CpaB [Candidatus Omnitrophica bacterium]|nr:Flp pilus assembly protein CpaB [Candidatus Omnitrophota bacterium]